MFKRNQNMKKVYILDNNRSSLSKKDIEKYKSEITKIKNSPVCPSLSTSQVIDIGIMSMEERKYRLIEGQLDV